MLEIIGGIALGLTLVTLAVGIVLFGVDTFKNF
jgi:hypothetical protein